MTERTLKVAQYLRAERDITAAEAGGIRARWLYGLRLLRDEQAMSPGGGGLRHGVAARLVAEAKARGFNLSEREIRRRLQCARTYPTETEIGHAVADFRTWRELAEAGFPAYDAPADEPPADHRTKDERDRDKARALLDLVGEQGSLFPLDTFEPDTSTLKELYAYAEEQEALTARFVARGVKRRTYLDELAAAVDGDLSQSWQAAHRAAYGEEPPS